jgi:hypothetical protein
MLRGRGNIFVFDEWSWIEFRRAGLSSILDSYNDHLLAAPLAIYQLLFRTVGLGDYTAYRVLAAVAHLICIATVFEFARRRIGSAALLLVIPLAFFGSGWEYELQGVNFGFTLSIALSVGALLALDAGNRRGDVLACALLTLGLVFSEFAVLFAIGIAVTQLIADRSLRRAWLWLVPLILYGGWWLAYHTSIQSSSSLGRVPKFAADMAASAAGGLFGQGLQLGRLILLALLVLVGWRIFRHRALTPRLVGLLVTAVAFWLSVAVSRDLLNRPYASHYIYTGAILLVLIVTESLRDVGLGRPVLALGAALALGALIGNIHTLGGGETYLRTASENARAELGALRVLGPTAPPSLIMDEHYAPQLIAGPYEAAARALGPAPTDTPAQLITRPESVRLAADDVLIRGGELHVTGAMGSGHGCRTLTPTATDVLLPPRGVIARVSAPSGAIVRARRFATEFDPRPLTLPPDARGLLIRPAPDAATYPWHLQLASAGMVQICAAARR